MYEAGYIDREDAVNRSSNPAKMEKLLSPAPARKGEATSPKTKVIA
jgi:hypothetical protein